MAANENRGDSSPDSTLALAGENVMDLSEDSGDSGNTSPVRRSPVPVNRPLVTNADVEIFENMNLNIGLEGPIGSGKSSLIEAIDEVIPDDDSVETFCEMVKAWCMGDDFEVQNGKKLLRAFYNDPHQFAYEMQLTVLKHSYSRALEVERCFLNKQGCFIVQERSFSSIRRIFLSHLDRYMDFDQADHLYKTVVVLEANYEKDQVKVGLHLPFTDCQERIRKRGRAGEELMSDEYYREHYYRYVDFMWSFCHYVIKPPKGEKLPSPRTLAQIVSSLAGSLRGKKDQNIPHWVFRTHAPFPRCRQELAYNW